MFTYQGNAVLACPDHSEVPIHVSLRETRDRHGFGSWEGRASTNDGHALLRAMNFNNSLIIKLPDGRQGSVMLLGANANGHGIGSAAIQGRGEPPAAAA
ncbi:MAG TPA: hypothetical protein VGD71_25815 [Kribbella sp.]|jgi:hypothetical protein